MLNNLNQTHKEYFTFLLSNSIPNHFDYRAGASLLFLFPYYVQIGLIQIFCTLESNIVEDFQVNTSTNLINPIQILQLTNNLLNRKLPPITQSLLLPKLNLDRYNNLFGYNLQSKVFFKNTITQIASIGLIGESSLFSTQDELLPRDRLEKFFKDIDYSIESLDKYVDIAVSNNRIEAAAIFCQYFNYPTQLTQQLLAKVELWNLNN